MTRGGVFRSDDAQDRGASTVAIEECPRKEHMMVTLIRTVHVPALAIEYFCATLLSKVW